MADPTAETEHARIFAGLNASQREAVETVRGPVAILAGAGTGKTTTITRRIAWQVLSGSFDAPQILAVTFTAKAAREMADRLRALDVQGLRVNTFHAEALAQFRRFSPDQPEILSSKGQILHAIAQRLPMPHRFVPLRDIAGEIEWAKNRRIAARDYLERVGTHEPPMPAPLMHQVYVSYEKRKRAAGMIDFEDLLERTLALLQEDARALGIVRSRYAAFTVDEYQDVNELQQALLDTWVGARDDVCVVGDDYQSIFGFTGASARHLLRFADRYERSTVVTLEDNHRSTPQILTVANRLVPKLGGSRKTLRAVRPDGPNPELRDFERGADEVAWVVERCRALRDEGVAWEDIAILFRINGRSEDYEEAFARAHIPYQVRDGSFLSRPAARSFFARAKRAEPAPLLDQVRSILGQLGFDARTGAVAGDEATRQADLARILALAEGAGDVTLASFCTDLRARFAPDEDGKGVQLMTYHRAKGLEFDSVFLPRLEDKEMPFALSTSAEDIAEERRLLYVGITRAKRMLFMSYARSRDGERRSKPRRSPFLDEIVPRQITQRSEPAAPKKREPRATVGEGPVFEALRRWRQETARSAGVPPYVVFHDSTLAKIADAGPSTPAELRQISGVGPLKTQRYADAVLAIVAAERARATA